MAGWMSGNADAGNSNSDTDSDSDSDSGSESDGASFAITADAGVTKLGFQVSGVPPDKVLVHTTIPGGWAEDQGLKTGDKFIAVNNKDLKSLTPDEFKKFMQSRPLHVTVMRKGVGQHAAAKSGASNAGRIEQESLPFYADADYKVLKLGFRPTMPPEKVLVEKVYVNSWAENSNIKVGDEIITVNGVIAKRMEESVFLEAMKCRPLRLMVQPPLTAEPRLFHISVPPMGAEVLVGGTRGIVRYVGPYQNERQGKGDVIGVELVLPEGNSDGMLEEKRYFQCAPLHGIFVDPLRIQLIDIPEDQASGSSLTAGQKKVLPKLGDKVVVQVGDQRHEGYVRYAGKCHFASGAVVGVQLNNKEGNTDGTVDGFTYFECEACEGIFCYPESVQPVVGNLEQINARRNAETALRRAIFERDTDTLPELLATAERVGVQRKVLHRGRQALAYSDGERTLELVGLGVSNEVLKESLGFHVRCELAEDLDEVPNENYLQRLEELVRAQRR